MRSVNSRDERRGATGGARRAALLLLLAGLAAAPSAAEAQQQARRQPKRAAPGDAQEGPPPQQGGRGFQLFANTDKAATGMKMSGQFGWGTTNLGPCTDAFTIFGDGSANGCGQIFITDQGGWTFQIYDVTLEIGAGPHDFKKIAQAYPDIRTTAQGGGFTQIWNQYTYYTRVETGPADNQAGRIFSGAASTNNGSCLDNSGPLNAEMFEKVTLLPGSNCAPTWGSEGFRGPRPLSDSAFVRLFQREGGSAKGFDYWKIPSTDPGVDQNKFLGDFSTYGEISDYYTEILRAYGPVTKRGKELGLSQVQAPGYPLGIDMRFEAFQFARPTLQNAVFYQMTVVNNSERIYGAPVDYDSLYMGLTFSIGGFQIRAMYYDPQWNALLHNENGTNSGCNGANTPSACQNTGFQLGASGYVTLKSPIGDVRNKLFSRPGNPFYDLAQRGVVDPNILDDTITMNHGHMCTYGANCSGSTAYTNDRRGFGMMASRPADVLDGRDINAITDNVYWRTFRNENFPNRVAAFNTYVPGRWDYNNDGKQDTIYFDTCSRSGCVKLWADTMPNSIGRAVKHNNLGAGNDAGHYTAGPFKLEAGDTTSFIWAFIGAPDSASFMAQLSDVTNAYLDFFVGAEPYPAPRVASVGVEPAVTTVDARIGQGSTPLVRIFLAPRDAVDPFLEKFAADLRAGSNPTFATLNELNPNLADSVDARARQNLQEVLVFKSCDNGVTFTSDADCDGDPTVDPNGKPLGTGWRPYATLTPDANGRIPSTYVDQNVIGGKTYLYSFVTRSRGFRANVLDRNASGDVFSRELVVADPLLSPLQRSRSAPTVAAVYVPIRLPAGATLAQFTQSTLAGPEPGVPITVRIGRNVPSGKYRLVFGNRFIVRNEITQRGDQRTVLSAVTVQDVVADAISGSTPATNVVIDSDQFLGSAPVEIASQSDQDRTSDTTLTQVDNGGTRTVVIDTVNAFGFAMVTPDNRPLFVSTALSAGETTPQAFLGTPGAPAIFLSLDSAQTGEFVSGEMRVVRANGDTLNPAVAGSAVTYLDGASLRRPTATGRYEFRFAGDAFGPAAPFRITTAAETRQQVEASLAARPLGTTGDTTARVAAIINGSSVVPDTLKGKTLVAAKFPFTVVNTVTNETAILAMPRRSQVGAKNSLVLGTLSDTLRVPVPEDVWLPGDKFFILERVKRPATDAEGRVILDDKGQPTLVTDTLVAFGQVTLGCTVTRPTGVPPNACNPLEFGTLGASAAGYLPFEAGTKVVTNFRAPFTLASEIQLDVTGAETTPAAITAASLRQVRVVPNPYIVQSQFDAVGSSRVGDPRLYFTGVPQSGILRVYSVSGQFLQQITWTEADLNGTGDLPYNLRTREGVDLASGLYIYVISATDSRGQRATARGKFVIIR